MCSTRELERPCIDAWTHEEVNGHNVTFLNGVIRIPLGMWDLDGKWFPNTLLKMSEEAQREHNLRNGYLC